MCALTRDRDEAVEEVTWQDGRSWSIPVNDEPEFDVVEAIPYRGFEIVRHRTSTARQLTTGVGDLTCTRWLIVDPSNKIASTPAILEEDAKRILDERLGTN